MMNIQLIERPSAQSCRSKEDAVKLNTTLYKVAIDKLKPGDIIFSYYPNSYCLKDVVIKKGQKWFENFQSHRYIHAAIYLGQGQVAEATKKGYVINSIDGERFKLSQRKTNEYRVFRQSNKENRTALSVAARSLGTRSVAHPYNYKTAFKSVFLINQVNTQAIKRLLKAGYFVKTGMNPPTKGDHQKFHCSFAASWLLQGVDAQKIFDSLDIQIPDLSILSSKKKSQAFNQWLDQVIHDYGSEIMKRIQITLNVKYTTPQRLYQFLVNHPEQFRYLNTFSATGSKF
ncbi:MAG: hypothetical protein ACHQUC_02115 [Chlamydiales bacterium]